MPSTRSSPLTSADARDTAHEVLSVIPLVMRIVATQLRAGGELPAPAHFGLLTVLVRQPSTVSGLAQLHGVSLPTISNSVSALIKRGWARRTPSPDDRRVLIVEVTPAGKAVVERVGLAAECYLAGRLQPLDRVAMRRLRAGLAVLGTVFANTSAAPLGGRARQPASRERL